MATYLNGVTDYIPQIQPFKPDFNFFQAALEKKQLQYEAGYEKVNSVYSQLLNSPLLRQSNKDRRDKLFNSIDNQIKRLAGVDLSLSENVAQAGKLFTPLINDQYFRKDLAFTKQYQGQLDRAEQLRRNPDPQSDEKYWEEGVSALHYMAEDFSKSSDESSLRYAAPRYTPFINTAEKLFKFAKDNDINVTNIDFNGGFIWTYKNGKPAVPAIQNVFSTLLQNDTRVRDMFQTQAYVSRKNYMQTNAANFGGDVNQAEQAYLKEKINQINQYYRAVNIQDEQKYTHANTKKKVIEEKIASSGVDPNVDPELVALYQNSVNDTSVQQSVLDKNKSVLTSTDFMSYDPTNLEAMRQRVDGAMASFLLDDMSNKVATDYAMAKFDVDVKEDPYVKMQVQFKYDMAKLKQEFDNNVILKLMDISKANDENNGDSIPGYDPLLEGIDLDFPGAGGTVSKDQNILAQNQRKDQETTNVIVSKGNDSAIRFLTYQNGIIKDPNATPAQKAKAEQDILSILGLNTIEEREQGYTFEKDAPTDWGKIGMGLLKAGPGMLIAPWDLGSTVAQGYQDIYEGAAGNEKVEVKGKVTKASGYVVKNAEGTYDLVSLDNVPGHNVYGSDNYIGNIQQKIKTYADENLILSRDQNAIELKKVIDNNQSITDSKKQLIEAIYAATTRNNEKVIPLLTKESGVPGFAANLFMNNQKTAPRTENEFIVEYVKAAKKDDVIKAAGLDPGAGYFTRVAAAFGREAYGVLGGKDESDYIEDAVDAYEDLKDAYERLSKTSELGLESYTDKLSGEDGINRHFTNGTYYGFDAANYKNTGFKLAIDFLKRDLIPNIASNTFIDDGSVKIVSGVSGLDVTDKEFSELAHDPNAATILKTFLSSAALNYGGKTGENQMRPTGAFTLSAVAANDANKIAMTWELSPQWIEKHAGTEKNKGLTWEMQNKETNQITFFMDADKAKSAAFISMQSTDEEMLMNLTGSLKVNHDGGNLELRRNADGSLSYFGSATYYQDGKMVKEPISGVSNSDLNATVNYWRNIFSDISQANMNYKNTLVTNSGNKVYDPNLLLQQ